MNKSSPLYIFGFILAVSVVCGAGVAAVHYSTQDILAKNATLHVNRTLAGAFELSVDGASAEAYEKAVTSSLRRADIKKGGRTYQVYHSKDGQKIGFVFSGMGFWDRISGVLVMDQQLRTIRNVRFLDQKETPGLGARIEERTFTDQFKGLHIDWQAAPTAHVIIGAAKKADVKNRVDAITGATQTSMALMNFLNSELAGFRRAYGREGK